MARMASLRAGAVWRDAVAEAGRALECSVRCRRSLLPKTGHGLPGENESSVKALFARSWRVGPRHEAFNRREAVPISFSMGWHDQRYWLARTVHFVQARGFIFSFCRDSSPRKAHLIAPYPHGSFGILASIFLPLPSLRFFRRALGQKNLDPRS